MTKPKLKASKLRRTPPPKHVPSILGTPVSVSYHAPAFPWQHCVHWYDSEQCCNCGEHGDPSGCQLNTHCQPENV